MAAFQPGDEGLVFPQPSRKLGADNEGVLGWLGLSCDDVARLSKEGVI